MTSQPIVKAIIRPRSFPSNICAAFRADHKESVIGWRVWLRFIEPPQMLNRSPKVLVPHLTIDQGEF
jgi:hypothetical protein